MNTANRSEFLPIVSDLHDPLETNVPTSTLCSTSPDYWANQKHFETRLQEIDAQLAELGVEIPATIIHKTLKPHSYEISDEQPVNSHLIGEPTPPLRREGFIKRHPRLKIILDTAKRAIFYTSTSKKPVLTSYDQFESAYLSHQETLRFKYILNSAPPNAADSRRKILRTSGSHETPRIATNTTISYSEWANRFTYQEAKTKNKRTRRVIALVSSLSLLAGVMIAKNEDSTSTTNRLDLKIQENVDMQQGYIDTIQNQPTDPQNARLVVTTEATETPSTDPPVLSSNTRVHDSFRDGERDITPTPRTKTTVRETKKIVNTETVKLPYEQQNLGTIAPYKIMTDLGVVASDRVSLLMQLLDSYNQNHGTNFVLSSHRIYVGDRMISPAELDLLNQHILMAIAGTAD